MKEKKTLGGREFFNEAKRILNSGGKIWTNEEKLKTKGD